MTLITSVVLGLALGFFLGFNRRALLVFGAVWLTVLLVQTFVVLDDEDIDAFYPLVQAAIVALGVSLIWLLARTRAWRAARAAR